MSDILTIDRIEKLKNNLPEKFHSVIDEFFSEENIDKINSIFTEENKEKVKSVAKGTYEKAKEIIKFIIKWLKDHKEYFWATGVIIQALIALTPAEYVNFAKYLKKVGSITSLLS